MMQDRVSNNVLIKVTLSRQSYYGKRMGNRTKLSNGTSLNDLQ